MVLRFIVNLCIDIQSRMYIRIQCGQQPTSEEVVLIMVSGACWCGDSELSVTLGTRAGSVVSQRGFSLIGLHLTQRCTVLGPTLSLSSGAPAAFCLSTATSPATAKTTVGDTVVTMTPRFVSSPSHAFSVVAITAPPLGSARHTSRQCNYSSTNTILTTQLRRLNASWGASALGPSDQFPQHKGILHLLRHPPLHLPHNLHLPNYLALR